MSSLLEQIAERVDRLLLRHEELHRTNALLVQQLSQVTREREGLQTRLDNASARLDALLLSLPIAPPEDPHETN